MRDNRLDYQGFAARIVDAHQDDGAGAVSIMSSHVQARAHRLRPVALKGHGFFATGLSGAGTHLTRTMDPNQPLSGAPEAVHPPPAPALLPALRTVSWRDPMRWLAAGWRDFVRQPGIGLFYGACFVVMGWAMAWMFVRQPAYTLVLASGFLLLGPFLCLGLYDVSRKLERGQVPTLAASLTAWRRNLGALAWYCGVLLILEMLWARSALVVFAVSFNMVPAAANTWTMLTDLSNLGFIVTYLVVGAVFAGLIFATSVVSIPMLLDRADDDKADAITAGLTSIRACLANPFVMGLWGALITALVAAATLPGFLGLVVVAPVIGHASWHAYRGIVAAPAGAPALATAAEG